MIFPIHGLLVLVLTKKLKLKVRKLILDIWVIDQACGQDGWILAKLAFAG